MRHEFIDGNGVRWLIDYDAAHGVIRHYATVQAIFESTYIIKTKDHILQRIGLISEDAELKQDWSGFKSARQRIEKQTSDRWTATLTGGWDDAQAMLIDIRRKANALEKANSAKFRNATEINNAAIEQAEALIKGARFVQDASIISLSVIATVSTGGTALFLASASGSALQGVSTYQRTGSTNKALIDGALFLIPTGLRVFRGAALANGQSSKIIAAVSIGIETSADTLKHVAIDEVELAEAIKLAIINQGLSKVMDFGADRAKTYIGDRLRGALNVFTDAHGGHMASNRTYSLAVETANKFIAESIKLGPSTPAEHALGVVGAQARSEFGVQSILPPFYSASALLCEAAPNGDEATRYVKQRVLTRL
ncbi:MAG: hypothetical protein ACE368_07690 [Paracoccaceae bacterium]